MGICSDDPVALVEQAVHLQQHIMNLTGKAGKGDSEVHCDQDIPVDHYLSDSKCKAILAHQYVDFATLIKKPLKGPDKMVSMQMKDDTIVIQKDQITPNHNTKDMVLWLSRYSVYATVLVRSNPHMSVGLFHYMNYVRSLKCLGYDWAKYNMSFCHLHAPNSSMYPFGWEVIRCSVRPHFHSLSSSTSHRVVAALTITNLDITTAIWTLSMVV